MERTPIRKYPRIEASFPVECRTGEGTQQVRALTLGGGGLFLGTAQMLAPDTELVIHFRPAKHLPVIEARARVRYQLPDKGIGIEFTEIAPEHRQMILRLIHHRMAEKRRFPRAPLATQVEHVAGTLIGFSKDISLGGMFIETNEPLVVGSKVKLLFHLDDTGAAVPATAEVLYAVLKVGIGVRFLDVSPADQARISAHVSIAPPEYGLSESASSP